MLLRLLLCLLVATQVRCSKFQCDQRLTIKDDWADGFRGILSLPVLDEVANMKEEMGKSDVSISFNQPIIMLDVPQFDQNKQVISNERKTYSNVVKFASLELDHLKKDDVFKVDMTVHFPRSEKGNIGLVGLQFGKFRCPQPKPEKLAQVRLPPCRIQMIDNSPTDGYRAKMLVPIGKSHHDEWVVEVGFTRPLLTLDVPDAVNMNPDDRNVDVFELQNREHNGEVHGPIFKLEFTTHFDEKKVKKKDVKISEVYFNGELKCQNRNKIKS